MGTQSVIEKKYWHERQHCSRGNYLFQILNNMGIMDKWTEQKYWHKHQHCSRANDVCQTVNKMGIVDKK